jgi:hypothetical protein
MPLNDYRTLNARDVRFDGVFFVGVMTTGIYCRPVCTAKAPHRSRCRFFPSAALVWMVCQKSSAGRPTAYHWRPRQCSRESGSWSPVTRRHDLPAFINSTSNPRAKFEALFEHRLLPNHLPRNALQQFPHF